MTKEQVLREFTDLRLLFNPRSIALVGASSRTTSVGGKTLNNLINVSRFQGDVYLVNSKQKEILGTRCYQSVEELPSVPDVAVITVPATSVLDTLRSCADLGIKFSIILTSGFAESGETGGRVELEMKKIACNSGMRIYGPNCPGLSNIRTKLGMSFSPSFGEDLVSGSIALITQGGGLGRTFMQAMDRGVGVGFWASAGNQADLEVSDFIYYAAHEPDIKVIVTIIEGFKSGRKFTAAIDQAARMSKPVVALKIGKSEYGARSAQSHTASITGSAEINSEIFAQYGVVEVNDIDELIDTAWLLGRCIPKGNEKLAVYSSSGGAAALVADMAGVAKMELAELSEKTKKDLRELLPTYLPVSNPIDVGTEIFTNHRLVDETLEVLADDPNVGAILYPYPLHYPDVIKANAESTIRVQRKSMIPIIPIWMSDRLGDGFKEFVNGQLVPSRSAGTAIKAVRNWINWGKGRQKYDSTFSPLLFNYREADFSAELETLTEQVGKSLLFKAGIRVLSSTVARTMDDATTFAESIGYPVVAKVVSPQIIHKTDVGGVIVGIMNREGLESAWESIMTSIKGARPFAQIDGILIEKMAPVGRLELLIGVKRDDVFGHFLTVGLGGIYVELFKEARLRMLPLSRESAESVIMESNFYPIINGARNTRKFDRAGLVDLLMRISDFISDNPEILEMDINPVWLGYEGEGAVPLDAVIIRNKILQ